MYVAAIHRLATYTVSDLRSKRLISSFFMPMSTRSSSTRSRRSAVSNAPGACASQSWKAHFQQEDTKKVRRTHFLDLHFVLAQIEASQEIVQRCAGAATTTSFLARLYGRCWLRLLRRVDRRRVHRGSLWRVNTGWIRRHLHHCHRRGRLLDDNWRRCVVATLVTVVHTKRDDHEERQDEPGDTNSERGKYGKEEDDDAGRPGAARG